MLNIEGADVPAETTADERTWSFSMGLGLLSILIVLPNLAGILASAGGCVLRASLPAVLVGGGLAGFGFLLGRVGGLRRAARLNAFAIVLVLLAPVLLLVVPIGMPNTGEAVTIGDLRSFVSAQQTYASTNGGHYEARLQCLSAPALCRPGYPAGAPAFLDAAITERSLRRGYVRMFVPGAWADPLPRSDELGFSETSVQSFVLIAVPENEDRGLSSYCVDSTGQFCYAERGRYPVAVDGRCGQCETLE